MVVTKTHEKLDANLDQSTIKVVSICNLQKRQFQLYQMDQQNAI